MKQAKAIQVFRHKQKGGIWIDAAHQLECQGCWLFPCLHIVGCSTDNGIYNGQFYTVVNIEGNNVGLLIYGADDEHTLHMCHIKANIGPCKHFL